MAHEGQHHLDGVYSTGEVNIGYYPYHMKTEGLVLKAAPRPDAPTIHIDFAGRKKLQPPSSKHADFGWQSTRNPYGVDNPPKRELENGYAFGYVRSGHSGYVHISHLVPYTPEELKTLNVPHFNGPAHADWEVGRMKCKEGYTSWIGRRVHGIRIIKNDTVYLRWAPESTARCALRHGDVVEILYIGEHHFFAVRVLKSSWVAAGTIGWIGQNATRRSWRPWPFHHRPHHHHGR